MYENYFNFFLINNLHKIKVGFINILFLPVISFLQMQDTNANTKIYKCKYKNLYLLAVDASSSVFYTLSKNVLFEIFHINILICFMYL